MNSLITIFVRQCEDVCKMTRVRREHKYSECRKITVMTSGKLTYSNFEELATIVNAFNQSVPIQL